MTIRREDGERLVVELELMLKGGASMRRDYLLAGQSLSHRQPMRNAGLHKRVAALTNPFGSCASLKRNFCYDFDEISRFVLINQEAKLVCVPV